MGWVDGNAGTGAEPGSSACVIAWALAIVGTWIILKICDAVTGVRAERAGGNRRSRPQHARRRRV